MSQAEAGPSRRRRGQYTSQACNSCRRRRCKCDGVHPICGTCSSTGHECTWIPDGEDPRPATKQYVESLRVKAQLLESQIAQLKLNLPPTPDQATAGLDPLPSDEHSPYIGAQPPTTTTQTPSQPTFTTAALPNIHQPDLVDQQEIMYQYIFNINTSIPFEEQSSEVQASLACEWNRHLPDLGDVQLSRLDHDTVLSRCFTYGASWLSGLIPDLFLRDMVRILSPETPHPPPALHYTPMLHCSLLAFAAPFSDNPNLTALTTRERFASHAKQWLDEEFNHPTPNLILSLSPLSEYHFGVGQQNTGYMYMGMSVRAARAQFGSQPPIRDWYRWSTYVQEKLMAVDRATPSAMPVPKVDLNIPIPVELGGRPRPTNSTEAMLEDPDYSKFVVEGFIQSCKLMVVAARMTDHTSHNETSIIDIHLQLDSWFNELPDSLLFRQRAVVIFPHVLSLHICYWWFILHLHLPFFRDPPSGESQPGTNLSIKMCERANEKIVQLLLAFKTQHGLRFFPRNMLKAIFTCGCALMTEHALSPTGAFKKRTAAQEGVETCISALRAISETWPCAEMLADKLEARAVGSQSGTTTAA